MATGIPIDDECISKFQELKLGHSVRYIIFKITDAFDSIEFEKEAASDASYDQFVEDLPENDCRYAVYDFEYEEDGGQRNKILFVVWAPDTARIKQKMLYASSKDALRKKLVGIGTEIQATDRSEIDYQAVYEKVNWLK